MLGDCAPERLLSAQGSKGTKDSSIGLSYIFR